MNGKSSDIVENKIQELHKIIPEIFVENKIDWEKLRVFFDEKLEFENERYMLNWAGKSNAFRILQQSTTDTLSPDRNESVKFDDTDNVFIEGENLTVLKILQKSYFNKIKMIYIDPPYNTGNDNFIYPDKFAESREDYLQRIGDKDETGYMTNEGLFRKNSKDSGHYHSNWLNMMYPRLFLARNLLRDDGDRKFICVQMPEKCDEKSEAYKAGYNTIADIAKERIRRVINKLTTENADETADTKNKKNKNKTLHLNFDEDNQISKTPIEDTNITIDKIDLGFKVFKQSESNFKIWRMTNDVDEETLMRELELHTNPINETAETENILFELLLKSGVTLTADIEYKEKIYFINRNELAVILDEINEQIIETVINNNVQKVLTLDKLFNNNDQLKSNTALQLKDAKIKFTVI